MKKHYLYFLILLLAFGCKKEKAQTADTPSVTVAPTMHIIITSSQVFSYNITESDPATDQFVTKDDYDVASLDYSFTPQPGHVVTIEAASALTGSMVPVVTYKDKPVGPITTHNNNPGTGFEFSYTVPSN
jgi:hypothetical protein